MLPTNVQHMARIARIVIPGIPHHVTQRGNRRQTTFFTVNDYELYLDLMSVACRAHQVEVWAYCLMTNHIHLIATPAKENSLTLAMSQAHTAYARIINDRYGWKGCFWQGRFFSTPMDTAYTLATARYVEMNPVRAGLVQNPADYRWSSFWAHATTKDDRLVKAMPLVLQTGDWRKFIGEEYSSDIVSMIQKNTRTGRPLGNPDFIKELEGLTQRSLTLKRPGPKPSNSSEV